MLKLQTEINLIESNLKFSKRKVQRLPRARVLVPPVQDFHSGEKYF